MTSKRQALALREMQEPSQWARKITPDVGATGYLIWREGRGSTTWCLSETPGCTVQSFQVRLKGWLGSFNDVSETADGYVRVTRITSRSVWVEELAPDKCACGELLPSASYRAGAMSYGSTCRECGRPYAEGTA